MIYRVTVDGTRFPDVDMDDLELGEKETLENMMGLKFDDDGKVESVNASGFTAAVIFIAWRRVDPSASLAKVRKLRAAQFDVDQVDEDPTPAAEPVEEEVGGALVTLEPPGARRSDAYTESVPGSSTASG